MTKEEMVTWLNGLANHFIRQAMNANDRTYYAVMENADAAQKIRDYIKEGKVDEAD